MINAQPKPQRITDIDRFEWTKTQPCLVSGQRQPIIGARIECDGPIDPHHVIPEGGGKGGSKVNDDRCVPLCRAHHRQAGRRAWFELIYGIDFESEICRLAVLYCIPARSPKRVLKKQPQATVQITGCICGKSHTLPFSRADVTRDPVQFKCPLRNLQVSAKMKGIR